MEDSERASQYEKRRISTYNVIILLNRRCVEQSWVTGCYGMEHARFDLRTKFCGKKTGVENLSHERYSFASIFFSYSFATLDVPPYLIMRKDV